MIIETITNIQILPDISLQTRMVSEMRKYLVLNGMIKQQYISFNYHRVGGQAIFIQDTVRQVHFQFPSLKNSILGTSVLRNILTNLIST